MPHELTEVQKMIGVITLERELGLDKNKKWRLSVITGDESWFYHRRIAKRESNKIWIYEDEKPKTVHRDRFELKTLFSFFFQKNCI